MLTDKETMRYQRQMLIAGWGEQGQEKIRSSRVFIAGIGGLGCPAALYLAAAGIGSMKICDPGEVYMTNLNRQVLYREWDVGRRKVLAAREALMDMNPHVDIEAVDEAITTENAARLTEGCALILDCLDNFETRHILNRVAVERDIPFVHAGIEGLSGQVAFIHTPASPCLYCLFPGSPPPKSVFPVAGMTPGIIGSLQACEAVKHITGIGRTLQGKLLVWDGELMRFETLEIAKNPDCPVCGG